MNAPGQAQSRQRRNKSRFGQQLEEKQNLKKIYGIREQQLKGYYKKASSVKEETGPYMIQLLERRLDNAVYRAGFAQTRAQARQMTAHRLFQVNGRSVDIPSMQLRKGDQVIVKESKRDKSYFTNFDKRMQNVQLPAWLELDAGAYAFRVVGEPKLEEANVGVGIQDIVEFLAR